MYVKFQHVHVQTEGLAEGLQRIFGHIGFAATVSCNTQFFNVLIPHSNLRSVAIYGDIFDFTLFEISAKRASPLCGIVVA
jgi:hypothetical protein